MSYARTLVRNIDADLLDRIDASGRPKAETKTSRAQTSRPAGSYRGARRNEARSRRNGGPRQPMLTYADLLRVNAIHAHRISREK